MKRIPELNQRIEAMAYKHDCTFIEYSKFVGPDGYIRKKLSTDGVHPNSSGYEELAVVINDYLNTSG